MSKKRRTWALTGAALLLAACQATSPVATHPGDTPCVISGCSGEICSDSKVASICLWREEYACYRQARCERDSAGNCGWRMTEELKRCLEEKRETQRR